MVDRKSIELQIVELEKFVLIGFGRNWKEDEGRAVIAAHHYQSTHQGHLLELQRSASELCRSQYLKEFLAKYPGIYSIRVVALDDFYVQGRSDIFVSLRAAYCSHLSEHKLDSPVGISPYRTFSKFDWLLAIKETPGLLR